MGLFEKKPNSGEACLEKGQEAMRNLDHSAAFIYFRRGAEEFKSTSCQVYLGKYYLLGLSPYDQKIELEMGVYWLKKAVEGGCNDFHLLVGLGSFYLIGGEGVDADEKEAQLWINKAMSIDNSAYCYIGFRYFWGNFSDEIPYLKIKPNYEKASKFLVKSLEENSSDDYPCLETLAKIYYSGGYGVERDYKTALYYAEKIPLAYKGESIRIMISIYGQGGDGVIKDLDKAFELCTKHLWDLSLEEGLLYQFHMYPPNYQRALKNYETAIERSLAASPRIGMMYFKGLGVKKNLATACSFFSRSRSPFWKGFAMSCGVSVIDIDYKCIFKLYSEVSSDDEYYGQAMNAIGKLYQDGLGVEQNYEKAKEYFNLAVKRGCSEAFNSMGDMYKYGYGVEIDYYKAFELYTNAAEEAFDTGGQFNLGMMYIEGKGTEVNYERALYWFERAHTFGNEQVNSSFIALAKALVESSKMKSKERLQFFHVEDNEQQNIANKNKQETYSQKVTDITMANQRKD